MWSDPGATKKVVVWPRCHRHVNGIALGHNVFRAARYLGVGDKIVPGFLSGVLTFGRPATVLVSVGVISSGL